MTAVFCCVGALAITGSLHHIDKDLLGWWLCERQDNKTGGLNGRPEKLPDVGFFFFQIETEFVSVNILGLYLMELFIHFRSATHGGLFLV